MTEAPTRGHPIGVNEATVSEAVLAIPTGPATRPSLEPVELTSTAMPVQARTPTFRALYDEHVDFVWRNLRRLGVSEADVEDRTQEVFVVAHRRYTEFEDRGHGPRAWLFQIVIRVASDARRHRRRHPEDPDGGHAVGRASIDATQQDAILRREQLSRLDAALSAIDVGRRAVLVMHEIEEMTAPEIAQALGIPLNTVYSRLRVGRTELEQALRSQEDEL
jgi:RNA polymerase sigma-70 factor (ECF subfamily)